MYSWAFPLWLMLWFNQSWNIIYYLKEVVLQEQGSESKRINAGGLLSKEGGKQWVSHTLSLGSCSSSAVAKLLFGGCWVTTEAFSKPALRAPWAHSSAPCNADLSTAFAMHIKELVPLCQLNSAIPTSNSSDSHSHMGMRPQDTTKALEDCITQGEPAACPYTAGAV